jgi:ATP-dependent protease ClpP protease subunit
MATPANTPPLHDLYAIFVDDINQANTARIVNGFTGAMASGNKHAHVMFQSWGGFVGDGVMLYNFLRSMSALDVSLYNSGQVASAAVIAYLGAKRRVASKSSIFMLHRSHNSPQFATASKMEKMAANLTLDDKRTEDILKAHVKMPDELWKQLENHDVNLTGEDAVKFGVATELRDFAPPAGTQIYKV